MLSKSAYRAIRYHPIVERLQNTLRKTSGVRFEEIDLFVPAGPGDVIIDAGANVGSITSKAARTGATVHAFEPNPICFATLQRRFAAQSNVHLHNKGLMDRNCTLTLHERLADRIGIAVVETHERFSPEVAAKTNDLKKRLEANGLGHWRLDWI